ncbi:MAG: hypothetical protein QJR12_03765 [Mycobacterium sp.]|uniref:hypothetical protein n=1 Tax=Mycobacterium sp. TaxID=1785 RepID=UPI002614D58E|nr:hypothetical protein [Mycobacterium sp.]MDI3313423.1 hypothetical protein [Mycobacterium sp.]
MEAINIGADNRAAIQTGYNDLADIVFAAVRVERRELVSAAVDTITAITQSRPGYRGWGITVEGFWAAHGLDTAVSSE